MRLGLECCVFLLSPHRMCAGCGLVAERRTVASMPSTYMAHRNSGQEHGSADATEERASEGAELKKSG